MYTYLHVLGDTTKDPCHVPFCRHRDGAEGCDCTFVRFPLDRGKRNQWIQEIGAHGHLEKQPSYLSKICSCHFENGDSSLVPSIFPWTEHPEKYGPPKTEKAKQQVAARAAARLKATMKDFEIEKSKIDQDTIYCDSIILTFDTSQITGNKKSTTMSVANVKACEVVNDTRKRVNDTPLLNGSEVKEKKTKENKFTQTSVLASAEVSLLKSQLETANKKLEKLSKRVFGVHMLRGKEDHFKFYTGIGEKLFNSLVNEMLEKDPLYRPKNLCFEDELLLTLMKLRLNSSYLDLTVRFNIAIATICPILTKHLDTLHSLLFEPMRKHVAITDSGSRVELTSMKNVPSIINCTSIVGESNFSEDENAPPKTTSKGSFKVLMGVTPSQVITYCSEAFRNNTSKGEIFESTDIHEFMKPGDMIVNDKDHSLLRKALKNDDRISEFIIDDSEVFRRKEHLCFGRAMRRLRNYQILPFFPQTLFRLATKILQVCVALSNYQNPHFWEEVPQREVNGTINSTELVAEEQVEVVIPEEETEEVIVTPDMDADEVIEVETEMDGDF